MVKIPYEILAPQVIAMYDKKFDEDDTQGIEEHCRTIEALIEGSGWDLTEYQNRWFYGDTN